MTPSTPSPDTLRKLTELIVAANPDGKWELCRCSRCGTCSSGFNRRPIRLGDVLLALSKNTEKRTDGRNIDTDVLNLIGFSYGFYPEGTWCVLVGDGFWYLPIDDLSQQIPETQLWLLTLLQS